MSKELISFEYIDRNKDFKLVQVGMFEKITSKDQIKIGEKFIVPLINNSRGIICANLNYPILLEYVTDFYQNSFHIGFVMFESERYRKGSPRGVAFDLCYRLRDDI